MGPFRGPHIYSYLSRYNKTREVSSIIIVKHNSSLRSLLCYYNYRDTCRAWKMSGSVAPRGRWWGFGHQQPLGVLFSQIGPREAFLSVFSRFVGFWSFSSLFVSQDAICEQIPEEKSVKWPWESFFNNLFQRQSRAYIF